MPSVRQSPCSRHTVPNRCTNGAVNPHKTNEKEHHRDKAGSVHALDLDVNINISVHIIEGKKPQLQNVLQVFLYYQFYLFSRRDLKEKTSVVSKMQFDASAAHGSLKSPSRENICSISYTYIFSEGQMNSGITGSSFLKESFLMAN